MSDQPKRQELKRLVKVVRTNEIRYCVLGPAGGVDFHCDLPWGEPATAGLEVHARKPPAYFRDKPPLTRRCWLTGGKCWSDGTTLYATEHLLSRFRAYLTARSYEDQEAWWKTLEGEYRRRFEADAICEEAHGEVRGDD